MKIVKAVAALIVITLAFGGGYIVRAPRTPPRAANGRTILYYVDPMHPAYKSDKPGVAPDCGMTLEPVYADEEPMTAGTSGRKTLYYRDPQQPDYRADKPGLNPETGNTLAPVYADAPQLTVPP